MRKIACWLFAFVFSITAAWAQDITGQWQGTLHLPTHDLKSILKIGTAADGSRKASFYSPDQSPNGVPVDTFTVQGAVIRFVISNYHISFEGALNADGNAISGQFTQGTTGPLELKRATPETAWAIDPSPHKVQFVTVAPNVKLEVLDWGGNGPALVLLAGGGDTAHVYDKFALNFIGQHHVYGITRRGFGVSSIPPPTEENYAADRLGDDVLEVISTLKLEKPFVAGHSFAGEELSSIGSRHPEKVSGLIYLDAANGSAYYTGKGSAANLTVDSNDLQRKLDLFKLPEDAGVPIKPLIRELLETDIPQVQRDLQDLQNNFQNVPDSSNDPIAAIRPLTPEDKVGVAMNEGKQKYTSIKSPILAIFAWPADVTPTVQEQAKALESGIPSARVVRLANATHYVYRSNEAEVVQEMDKFMNDLPK